MAGHATSRFASESERARITAPSSISLASASAACNRLVYSDFGRLWCVRYVRGVVERWWSPLELARKHRSDPLARMSSPSFLAGRSRRAPPLVRMNRRRRSSTISVAILQHLAGGNARCALSLADLLQPRLYRRAGCQPLRLRAQVFLHGLSLLGSPGGEGAAVEWSYPYPEVRAI